MRIAFLSPAWPAARVQNGIATYVDIMTRGLIARGHDCVVIAMRRAEGEDDREVHYVSPRRPGLLSRIATRARVQVERDQFFDFRYWGDAVADAVSAAHAAAPLDVVEIEESFGFARYVAPKTHAAVVVRSHGPHFLVKQGLMTSGDRRRIEREGAGFAAAAAASFPSEALRDAIAARYALAFRAADVYPNPVEIAPPADHWRLEACDRNMLLFVGRFDLIKGADLVLAAFSKLALERPALKLVMVGPDRGVELENGDTAQFRDYVEAHVPEAVRSRIDFRDALPREEIPALRRKAFLCVGGSRYETYHYALLESTALGAPAVSTSTASLSEYFEDGVDMALVPTGDAEALARRIAEMLDDPSRAAQYAAAGRARLEAIAAPETVAAQAETFYRRILGERRPHEAPAS